MGHRALLLKWLGSIIRHPVSAFDDHDGTELVALLKNFGQGSLAIYCLYNKYQQYPPRTLLNSVVTKAIENRKIALEKYTLDGIDSVAEFSTHPEQVIKGEILKQIPRESILSSIEPLEIRIDHDTTV
ncbi:hypothetical protein CVT25_003778 [Psilocybe cyanescens]|uniref:Uncharacterized protein n=1 Tax=Psilocybe cyanescens TaxID=93625 RepID=A0A409WX62_PSICY|nr:hypothetical protein CVT25_003778 [Psilocybe cyanescens]